MFRLLAKMLRGYSDPSLAATRPAPPLPVARPDETASAPAEADEIETAASGNDQVDRLPVSGADLDGAPETKPRPS